MSIDLSLALRAREMDRVTGLHTEQLVNRLLPFTADAHEGPAALAERRPLAFKGE